MNYVCVIGGANIDVVCTPLTTVRMRDSNPCTVRYSLGGVARNIAENLARLGVKVVFITALAGDANAERIESNAASLGIDLSHCVRVNDGVTSTYTCINDEKGDMLVAASDMSILKHLTCQRLEERLDVINGAQCVVTDTNDADCLRFLQQHVTVPLFVDTVSAKKTEIVKNDIKNIFCLKPNLIEAEVLSGIEIRDSQCLQKAVDVIRSKGVNWVFVSQGNEGVTYSDGATGHVDSFPVKVVNTTGAGDSFMAGVVCGYINGMGISHCAMMGCAASAITVSDRETVSESMSVEKVNNILKGELQ